MLSFLPIDRVLAHHDALFAHALQRPASALFFDEPKIDATDDVLTLRMRAPGIAAKDLCVTFEDGTLHIKGETATATQTHFIERTFRLDAATADVDKATATCVDGIITVDVPKKEAQPEAHTLISVVPGEADLDMSDDSNSDSDASYTLTATCPGYAPSDLSVECRGRLLKVEGESKRLHSKIHKLFRLPRDADGASATASCADGILSVVVPKVATEKTTIVVNATTGAPCLGAVAAPEALAATCGCAEGDASSTSACTSTRAEGAADEEMVVV